MRLLRPSALPTLRAAPRPRSKACARVVLHRPKTTRYTATMEPGAASQEQADFNNVAVTRYAAAGHNGSAAVARLGLGSGQQTGPAKTLQVAKGDTITFTAYAWLTAAVAATSNSTSPKNPPLVLPAPQPSTAPPAAPGADGAPTKRSGLPTVGISVALPIGGPDDAAPQGGGAPGIARLHYRVLDAQGTVLLDDYQTANGATPATWQTLQVGLRLPQAGSVQLSVETNGAAGPTVYFDDVSVAQTGGLIVQEQHQYAFGAPLPGLSYTVGSTRYRHGYQGQFADKDEETGFDSFELRLYNSRIGRWMAPDPAGQFDSPYVGMGNNPVTGTDADGGWSYLASMGVGAAVGAAVGGYLGYQESGRTGMWGGIVGGAAFGGLAGAGAQWAGSSPNLSRLSGLAAPGVQVGANVARTWYYLYQHDDSKHGIMNQGHALVFNPDSKLIYEINHANASADEPDGFKMWTDMNPNTPKSKRYVWDVGTMDGANGIRSFWNFRGGRGQFDVYPVTVLNPSKAANFFERDTGKKATYNLFLHNCKHHSIQGLRLGGATLRLGGALPSHWINSERIGTWKTIEDVGTIPGR